MSVKIFEYEPIHKDNVVDFADDPEGLSEVSVVGGEISVVAGQFIPLVLQVVDSEGRTLTYELQTNNGVPVVGRGYRLFPDKMLEDLELQDLT